MTTPVAVVSLTAVSAVLWSAESPGPVRQVRTVLLNPRSGNATGTGTVTVDEHVRVRLPAGNRRPLLGDVLVGPGTGAASAAETALSHPGALVVAVHHGSRCWLRLGPDGTALELETVGPGQPPETWGTLASLAHAWLVAGLPAAEFGSAPLCLLRDQASGWSSASRPSRRRADSASGDPERPTEE
ncbi:transcriptional regulator [Streptomyces shenzhenensis]|uniref:transcriptional regulator n=1 Tax=Streptomyces shenzhenensis TaxID=943815 RepID=UPI0033DAC187